MHVLIGAIALLAAAEPTSEPGEFKPSLSIETPEESWRQPGFRVGIGYGVDDLFGRKGVPGGIHHAAILRFGPRLDETWSLLATLRYEAHFGVRPALRFGGTIEPTLHLGDRWSVAIGLGIGGFIISDTGSPTPQPDIVATVTLPSTHPLLNSCQGEGPIALVRVEHAFIVSELFSTGPALQFDAQWTACVEHLNRSDPDTGEAIDLQQYWQHYGVSLSWMFWWR